MRAPFFGVSVFLAMLAGLIGFITALATGWNFWLCMGLALVLALTGEAALLFWIGRADSDGDNELHGPR